MGLDWKGAFSIQDRSWVMVFLRQMVVIGLAVRQRLRCFLTIQAFNVLELYWSGGVTQGKWLSGIIKN